MPSYINVTFNHFAALQEWAARAQAEVYVDVRDMSLHVRRGNRALRMFPMFQAQINGNFCHVQELSPHARGFGGWRPYETLTHTHGRDKALFKSFLAEAGLRTPAMLDAGAPAQDYVLKANDGSFGCGMSGPCRAGRPAAGAEGRIAEQFVPGRMLKVWYWGSRPFFAHVQDYPCITGDGVTDAAELVRRELVAGRVDPEAYRDLPLLFDCLAYQGIARDDVMEEGRSAWIDYRYNHLYSGESGGSTRTSDDALDALQRETGAQLQDMGEALDAMLRRTWRLPVAITVDGVLDAEGRIWWLEMNTNSVLPPEGYAVMLEDILAAQQPAHMPGPPRTPSPEDGAPLAAPVG